MKKYLVIAGALFLALAVALYFFHPLGPVFLLLSLLIQAPLVWGVSRSNFKKSYVQRSEERREKFAEDGDAQGWLAAEQAEARSVGYRYWSRAGRQLCSLNQAEALAALGRFDECRQQLEAIEYMRLDEQARKRCDVLEARMAGKEDE